MVIEQQKEKQNLSLYYKEYIDYEKRKGKQLINNISHLFQSSFRAILALVLIIFFGFSFLFLFDGISIMNIFSNAPNMLANSIQYDFNDIQKFNESSSFYHTNYYVLILFLSSYTLHRIYKKYKSIMFDVKEIIVFDNIGNIYKEYSNLFNLINSNVHLSDKFKENNTNSLIEIIDLKDTSKKLNKSKFSYVDLNSYPFFYDLMRFQQQYSKKDSNLNQEIHKIMQQLLHKYLNLYQLSENKTIFLLQTTLKDVQDIIKNSKDYTLIEYESIDDVDDLKNKQNIEWSKIISNDYFINMDMLKENVQIDEKFDSLFSYIKNYCKTNEQERSYLEQILTNNHSFISDLRHFQQTNPIKTELINVIFENYNNKVKELKLDLNLEHASSENKLMDIMYEWGKVQKECTKIMLTDIL